MALERKNLSVNELDFNLIRGNIKTFLNNQTTFTDYDFESSGLSVILDILSYFTHYQGVYNNLVANELFLDSAVKRSSLVSHAKNLGYTPRSVTAPVAIVDITNFANPDNTTTLKRGTRFRGRLGNSTYTFVPIKDYPTINNSVSNVELYQGEIKSVSFVVPTGDPTIKYTIPDSNVDTKSVKVQVYESASNLEGLADVWSESNNYTQIGAETAAFFLQEDFDESYSVSFGDGVIGKKLSAGNVVLISYITTMGAETNGLGKADTEASPTFVVTTGLGTVKVVTPAAGGGEKESISSIRFNAPKAYSAQNRAITTNDFEALVANNFGGFRSVYAFGGEDAEPPEFGKVILTLNPIVGSIIPTSLKVSIESFLRQRCSVGVTPEVVDPIPLYVTYSSNVIYNPSSSFLNETALREQIENTIETYIIENTNDFNTSVSLSGVQKRVLDGFNTVKSMTINPRLEFRFIPAENTTSGYDISFKNPILHPHDGHMAEVSSNLFKYTDEAGVNRNVYLDDDGNGILRIYELIGGEKVYVNSNFGVINYDRGTLSIGNYNLGIAEQGSIRIRATISGSRLVSSGSSILLIDQEDPSRKSITMFPDTRPDRQIISSNSAEGTFLGTSSISRQITQQNVTGSTTVTGTQNPVGGGGGPGSGLNQPPAPDFDPIQLPDSGDGGY